MSTEFRVLGTVEALNGGQLVDLGHSRQRSVLAVLLVEANRPVPVDQFMDHVWGEHLPQRGREALYSYLSRLRTILAAMPDVTLERRATGYVLTVDEASVDLHRFRQLLTQARASDDSAAALTQFDQALGLWRGTAFAELDSPWPVSMRTTLDLERRAAELDRTDAALRCGRHAEILSELTAQTDRYPLDERLASQLMLALYRTGRPADALQHYQHLRTELAEQLGTDPNPAVQGLYQQILTADPALTSPTARPAGKPDVTPRQLPPAPAWFTGRTSELAALTLALDTATTAANTVVISALAGAGGIGKTWLALHWAHQHLDRFPDGQLFVDLRGFSPDGDPLDPLPALRGFLDALGTEGATVTGGLDEHSARYRSVLAGKRMLIVLDNAATADQITPLLPGTATCTVLVTSRTILTSLLTRHGARHLTLDVLTYDEAHMLFVHRLGAERVAAEPDAVAELIRLCGRYPLALSIMASRAQAHPRVPLADFAAELREASLNALNDADPATSLPAVLSWSLRGLTTQQREVFALLGIAPGPDIGPPAAASLTGLPAHQVRAALRALADASLVDRHAHDRYAMHDLIRNYAAATAHDMADEVREAGLRRVLDFYAHTAHSAACLLEPARQSLQLDPPTPDAHPESLPDRSAALIWFDTEHAVLLAVQHTAADQAWYHAVWQLAWAISTFHLWRGYRHDELIVWRAAVDAAAHLPDPASRIRAHVSLGRAYANVNRHEEAMGHLRQALVLAEHHRDPLRQAHAHIQLAQAWERQGDHRQALRHATRALHFYRAVGQPVREAAALNAMGWHAAHLGEYDAARAHCHNALALHERAAAEDRDGQACVHDSLGYIAHRTGQHPEAIQHYQQAAALFRGLGDSYTLAGTLAALGHSYVALDQHDQARTVWHEALQLCRHQGRDNDVDQLQRQLDNVNRSGAHETKEVAP